MDVAGAEAVEVSTYTSFIDFEGGARAMGFSFTPCFLNKVLHNFFIS